MKKLVLFLSLCLLLSNSAIVFAIDTDIERIPGALCSDEIYQQQVENIYFAPACLEKQEEGEAIFLCVYQEQENILTQCRAIVEAEEDEILPECEIGKIPNKFWYFPIFDPEIINLLANPSLPVPEELKEALNEAKASLIIKNYILSDWICWERIPEEAFKVLTPTPIVGEKTN